MKVEGVRGAGAASPAGRSAPAAAPGFAPAAAGPERTSALTGVQAPAALDAILALQAGEPDGRRRQARRGKRILDALDRLTRALLEGVAPAGLRSELLSLRSQSQPTGDPGLDEVLLEIDTRAAVELAKLEAVSAPR